MNHHQNALEALAQLSAVAGLIDTAECKDEGLYNRLQGALAVANASLDDAMKALSAAPPAPAAQGDAQIMQSIGHYVMVKGSMFECHADEPGSFEAFRAAIAAKAAS